MRQLRARRRGYGWWRREEASRHARTRKERKRTHPAGNEQGKPLVLFFGLEKNERANVTGKEVEALQQLAADLLRLSPSQLDEHVGSEALKEICHDNESQGR